jgi:FMN phosphatase YigB (HAD superfamily)
LALVTIDFHNTLFHCDQWFRLEIETLPLEFLAWRAKMEGGSVETDLAATAQARYRHLRQEVMATGRECDAVSSMRRVLRDLNLPYDGDDVEAGIAQIMRRAVKTAQPLSGAVDLTRRLHEAGMRLAVVSSAAYHPFLEWCLQRHDMRDTFSAVVSSASCGIYKSDPAIYQFTLDLLDANPEESVHIGDSHRFDIASASRVGIRTILLANGDTAAGLDPPPDATITHLGDAAAHLVRLLPRYTSI